VRKLVPNVVLGRDVFWWLDKIGLLFAGRDSVVAEIMRKRDPIPVASANDAQLLSAGVVLKPRAIDAQGTRIFFSDGSDHAVNAVVWCGGYRENLDWIDLPLINEPGSLTQGQGLTPEQGFYLVGRKWLTCRASELVLGVERDATKVVGYVTEQTHIAGQQANNKEALAHV
jgi:putative flavoprotein involved in K+ transport